MNARARLTVQLLPPLGGVAEADPVLELAVPEPVEGAVLSLSKGPATADAVGGFQRLTLCELPKKT